MKRPLVSVALLYAAGLLLAELFPLPPGVLLAVSLLLALFALFWSRARPVLLWPLIVLTGATNLTLHTAVISPNDLRRLIDSDAQIVSVRGKLPETPYHRVYERDEVETWRTIAVLGVREIHRRGEGWRPAYGRIAVSTPDVLPPDYFTGVQVEIRGVLKRPKPPKVEGAFDYRTYLKRQGIYFQLQVDSTNDWKTAIPTGASVRRPLADRFSAWAKDTLRRGLPAEDEPLRLLWAMTLGWRTALTGEVAQPFMRSGTMHIFAISGLHVALIAGILVSLLRVLQLPRGICGLIVVPMLWFYTAATGWQSSAMRSTVMMTIIIAGWSLKRPSDLLNSLAAAALIILLWEPLQLFQASFQLSFFVVLSLALFGPVFQKIQKPWFQADPFLPEELRPRWQRWLLTPARWLAAGLTTSLAACLGSIPLIAHYFHLFTPVSLLANVIIVPLAGLALASTLASWTVGGWLPACSELFNHSAWFWMFLMSRVSEWAAELPGAWFYVASPPAIAFVFYYAALISFLAGWWRKPRVRMWVIVGLSVLGGLWMAQLWRDRGTTRISIIPLNGGSAVYCDAPARQNNFLENAGNLSAAEFTLTPFLRARGVNRLLLLVLAHGDANLVGGAPLIVERFSPRVIATNAIRFRSPVYREVLNQLNRTDQQWLRLQRGDRIGNWTVLHPQQDDVFARADDGTLVLRGDFDGTRILLLSDLGWAGQKALLEREADLRADIVVAGLPARDEPLSNALLDAIQPRLVVIADSEFPANRRASPALRQRLAAGGIPIVCAHEVGSINILLRNGEWRLETALGVKYSSQTGQARSTGER